MRYLKLTALAGLTLALAGCPERDPDTAATDVQLRDTLPSEQQRAAPASETFSLDPFAGSGVSGEVRATPREGQIELQIAIEDARPNSTVPISLHTGSCEAPGPEVADLGEISTDQMGRGQTQATVGLPPQQVLNGMHIIAAHLQGGETPIPIACSRVPEHRTTSGITTSDMTGPGPGGT